MAKVDTIGEHTIRRRRKKTSWPLSCFFSTLCAADSQPIFSFEVAITVRWQAYAGHVWQTLCGTCTPASSQSHSERALSLIQNALLTRF